MRCLRGTSSVLMLFMDKCCLRDLLEKHRTDVRDTFIIPKKPMFIMFFRNSIGHQASYTVLVIYVYDKAFWDICTYIYASIVTMKCPYNKLADSYTPPPKNALKRLKTAVFAAPVHLHEISTPVLCMFTTQYIE